MGTFSRPDIIRTTPQLGAAQMGAQINAAIQNTWVRTNAAYQENLKKNEEQRIKDIEDFKEWGRQLNEISDTGYGGFQANERTYLEEVGDLKYDLKRRQRLNKKHPDYLTDIQAARLDIEYENVPKEVAKLNGALGINIERYLKMKKDGTLDLTRSNNGWIKVMDDYVKHDGNHMSIKGGNLIYTGDDGKETVYNGAEFIRGSLLNHNLLYEKGDRVAALSSLVNGAMGKGDDGKQKGWYGVGLQKTASDYESSTTTIEFDNKTLFYGDPKDSRTNGIYALDYNSILSNEDQMESLWGALQQDGVRQNWVDGEGEQILKDDYEMQAWNPNPESDSYKLAARLLPASISADRTKYGIQKDAPLIIKQDTHPSTWKPNTALIEAQNEAARLNILETENFYQASDKVTKFVGGFSNMINTPYNKTVDVTPFENMTYKGQTVSGVEWGESGGKKVLKLYKTVAASEANPDGKVQIGTNLKWDADNLSELVKSNITGTGGQNKESRALNKYVDGLVTTMMENEDEKRKIQEKKMESIREEFWNDFGYGKQSIMTDWKPGYWKRGGEGEFYSVDAGRPFSMGDVLQHSGQRNPINLEYSDK